MALQQDSDDQISRSIRQRDILAYQLRVVLRLGSMLLGAGASSFRVKASMNRLAHAVGIEEHRSLVTMTEIVSTGYSHGTFRTEIAEQRSLGVNADLIDRLNRFVSSLDGQISVEEAEERLSLAEKNKRVYSKTTNMLASGFACAGFSFLNDGTPIHLLAVFIAATVGQWVRRLLIVRGVNHVGVWMFCGALSSAIYIGFLNILSTFLPDNPMYHGGVIAAVLFLVPGFPLLTSLLEMIRQDLSAAVPRMIYSIGLITAVGVSLWVVVTFMDTQATQSPAYAATTLPLPLLLPLQGIASFVAAYGFAMLFNAPPLACLGAALIGTIVNVPRIFAINEGAPRQLAIGIASLVIGLLAAAVASKTRYSRVSLSVPAAVIMIPGVYLYQAFSDLNNAQVGAAADSLTTVLFSVLSIGAGLAIARMLTDRNWLIDRSPDLPVIAKPTW